MKSGKKLEKKSKKTLKKKKLSSNITTIILILIFLVGLSVMLYPTVSNYVINIQNGLVLSTSLCDKKNCCSNH